MEGKQERVPPGMQVLRRASRRWLCPVPNTPNNKIQSVLYVYFWIKKVDTKLDTGSTKSEQIDSEKKLARIRQPLYRGHGGIDLAKKKSLL